MKYDGYSTSDQLPFKASHCQIVSSGRNTCVRCFLCVQRHLSSFDRVLPSRLCRQFSDDRLFHHCHVEARPMARVEIKELKRGRRSCVAEIEKVGPTNVGGVRMP